MRVIAGSARSIPLITPEGTETTRPTQDRIKETLFNIIQMQVPGSVFLDLCAGSGSIGIEALSRGAKRAYFVENAREAVSCIQANLHKTHFEESGILLKSDVLTAIANIHEKAVDLVYLDPPYASPVQKRALELLSKAPYVTEDTIIIVEALKGTDFGYAEDLGLSVYRVKEYLSQEHVFIRKTGTV